MVTSCTFAFRVALFVFGLQGMTASNQYVWFLPAWFTHRWWDIDTASVYASLPCTTSDMLEVVQGYFYLSNSVYGPHDSHIVGNMTVKEWHDNYIMYMSQFPLSVSRSVLLQPAVIKQDAFSYVHKLKLQKSQRPGAVNGNILRLGMDLSLLI